MNVPHVRIKLVRENEKPYGHLAIADAADVVAAVKSILEDADRELFVVLALDASHTIVSVDTVSVGTLNSSVVHPREVFKSLILANAAAFIAVHNHPSEAVQPSGEDEAVTKSLREAGELVGIRMLDHVIVGEAGNYFSFQQEGRL